MQYPRFDPASPITPLTPTELATLDALLPGLPSDAAMSLDGMDGYLTALVVGPAAVLAGMDTAEWAAMALKDQPLLHPLPPSDCAKTRW
jgi:uncharacterized protein